MADFGSVELSEFTPDGELRKINDLPIQLKFDRKEKDEALLFQKGRFWCVVYENFHSIFPGMQFYRFSF